MGQTVNLLAPPSKVRNLPHPHPNAVLAQLVEQLFCKQHVMGSSPLDGSVICAVVTPVAILLQEIKFSWPLTICAVVAQLVEHLHGKEVVSGSNPLNGSNDEG